MPIHDWARVSANLFHHFHQVWTTRLADALNGGLLPPGYSALVEQHAGGLVPDVVGLQRRPRSGSPPQPSGAGVVVAEPRMRHALLAEVTLANRANRVAIRHQLGRVVCLIEIVSPGNKSSGSALRSFVAKAVEFLNAGVHLLVVDLFPPSPERDPLGIHQAIWDEISPEQIVERTPEEPLTLAAYVAAPSMRAYVEPVAVGQILPDMPAFLDEDAHVPVPLESTYQATWASCPEDMRAAVEGREPTE